MKTIRILMAGVFLGLASSLQAQQDPAPVSEGPLSGKQVKMVTIAAHTAKGDLDRLKVELASALEAGMTVNELKEVLVHLYAYCGFPRSIRGLQTLMAVVAERRASGKNEEAGRTATPIADTRSRYERGQEIQMKITGRTEQELRSGYAAFSPEIEAFLKEHLFADLFERDLLNFQEREIVTIAALISMGGVEPMLQSHFNAGMTVGLTPGQLERIVAEFDAMPSKKEAADARTVLQQALSARKMQ